jgi:hypothetical protein
LELTKWLRSTFTHGKFTKNHQPVAPCGNLLSTLGHAEHTWTMSMHIFGKQHRFWWVTIPKIWNIRLNCICLVISICFNSLKNTMLVWMVIWGLEFRNDMKRSSRNYIYSCSIYILIIVMHVASIYVSSNWCGKPETHLGLKRNDQ